MTKKSIITKPEIQEIALLVKIDNEVFQVLLSDRQIDDIRHILAISSDKIKVLDEPLSMTLERTNFL